MGCLCTLYVLLRDGHDVINTCRLRRSKHQSRLTLGLLHEHPWLSSSGLYPFKMPLSEQYGTPITLAPRWGDPHLTLSSAFNHHRNVPTFHIVSKRSPVADTTSTWSADIGASLFTSTGREQVIWSKFWRPHIDSVGSATVYGEATEWGISLSSCMLTISIVMSFSQQFIRSNSSNTTPIDAAVTVSTHLWGYSLRVIYL